jgi:hypothetical protein
MSVKRENARLALRAALGVPAAEELGNARGLEDRGGRFGVDILLLCMGYVCRKRDVEDGVDMINSGKGDRERVAS